MANSQLDRVFLSAQWRWLVMANWEVDPELLEPLVPFGTELDFFQGKTYVSIVGFLFLKTRLLGVPVPFHRDFEELNLRFYVQRNERDELRRGVAFINELVPKRAIAYTARRFYNENYLAVPMAHQVRVDQHDVHVRYEWTMDDNNGHIQASGSGPAQPLNEGSLEQFIAEHYWGYSAQRDGSTLEYRVRHAAWDVCSAEQFEFQCDVTQQYGQQYADLLAREPDSVLMANGSDVTVSFPRRIAVGEQCIVE